MVKCPHCKQDSLRYEPMGIVINDGKVFEVRKEFCNNPKCSHYCGKSAQGKPIRLIRNERTDIITDQAVSDLEGSI